MWKKIKKVRRGSRAARELCEHLQRLGIDARMIEEEGNRVALTGQEIDIVKVSYFGGTDYQAAHYSIYYGVHGLGSYLASSGEIFFPPSVYSITPSCL
jgi:RNase P/RNase MRP subunit p30